MYRHWNRLTRWHSLDGYAYGLAIGLGIGRIGCYAVGEHFGSLTSFPLAVRYDGGPVREDFIGSVPLEPGMVFHQTALYELMYMVVLFVILSIVLYVRKPRPGPGTAMAIFCGFYGVARFASDSLRVNDETLLGPHRRPVPLPGAAPHQRVDLVPSPQAARPGHRGRHAGRHRAARIRTKRSAAPTAERRRLRHAHVSVLAQCVRQPYRQPDGAG